MIRVASVGREYELICSVRDRVREVSMVMVRDRVREVIMFMVRVVLGLRVHGSRSWVECGRGCRGSIEPRVVYGLTVGSCHSGSWFIV